MFKDKILVSIICLTYNQEKYISKTIESLVNQDTTFNYEIIIHDDCSKDKTPEIIKQYKNKYPDKIRLILQKENQYSKGVCITDDIVVPITRGEYIALCEGDDYWIDKKKLQKQIDALKMNSQCWICAHAVRIVNEEDTKKIGKIAPSKKNRIFDIKDVIDGDGGFVGTNSLLIKREVFDYPYTFRKTYPLDYFLQIMGTLNGGMLYLADEMSAYRSCSENSWTSRMLEDKEKYILHYEKIISALQQLDQETDGLYHEIIYKKIQYQKFYIIKLKREYLELFEKRNHDILNALSLKEKIKIVLKIIFPWIDDFIAWRKKYGKQ